jgi:hypothetical protein
LRQPYVSVMPFLHDCSCPALQLSQSWHESTIQPVAIEFVWK